MDSQSYLNEISSTVRPEKKSKTDIFKSKYFLVGIGVVAALIGMAIIGSVISGGRAGIKEQGVILLQRLDSISSVISNYQSSVKSSDLRSSASSLTGVLSNTKNELTAYMEETYEYKSSSVDKKIKTDEEAHKGELEQELFKAKINGSLDRIFAHKMAYEISLISTMETSLYKAAKNENLKSIMEKSSNSLVNIYTKFSEFSETK